MQDATDGARPALARQSCQSEPFAFALTDEEFDRIRSLICRVAGISLASGKKDLVYSRLARRLRARRLGSFAEYLRVLESGDRAERVEFVNALTTNLTSFFREAHHFPILRQHLAALPKTRPVSIWTCAASTGEEPYSIAMTVVEHFDSFDAPVRILATDIDTNVLEKARRGVFALDQMAKLPQAQLKRFFLKGEGSRAGYAKVRPELQKMITFQRLNLLDSRWPIGERFDAIFCRNVMIYFDKATQYAVLEKVAPYLQPEGLFFAGHSECFHHAVDLFQVRGKTVYCRKN